MFDAATCYHYVIAFVCCDVGEQKPINTEVKRRVIIRLCTASLTDIVLFISPDLKILGVYCTVKPLITFNNHNHDT